MNSKVRRDVFGAREASATMSAKALVVATFQVGATITVEQVLLAERIGGLGDSQSSRSQLLGSHALHRIKKTL